jgi:hypothetical protein
MKILEESRNLVLLATVTLFSAVIVAGVALLEQPAPAAAQKPVYVADQRPVRVVGTPFVPNTNPRER